MIKYTWLFLINEIWIITCFQTLVQPKKKLFWLFNTVYHDIFWDYYHTVKISYRYNPTSSSNLVFPGGLPSGTNQAQPCLASVGDKWNLISDAWLSFVRCAALSSRVQFELYCPLTNLNYFYYYKKSKWWWGTVPRWESDVTGVAA